MSLSTFDADLDIIAKLDDEPNDVGGLSGDALKAEFDKAGNIIKNYINKTLIPEITSDIDAAAQGIPTGGGISGEILQDDSISGAKIKSINGEKIEDGTIPTSKHIKGSITRELLAEDAITLKTEDFPNKVVPQRALADNAVNTPKVEDGAITPAKLSADAKSKGVAVVLTVAGWASNTQAVNVEGVTADNNVLVAAAPDTRAVWNEAEVYCSAQVAGTLIFMCSAVPTTDVTANVVILP